MQVWEVALEGSHGSPQWLKGPQRSRGGQSVPVPREASSLKPGPTLPSTVAVPVHVWRSLFVRWRSKDQGHLEEKGVCGSSEGGRSSLVGLKRGGTKGQRAAEGREGGSWGSPPTLHPPPQEQPGEVEGRGLCGSWPPSVARPAPLTSPWPQAGRNASWAAPPSLMRG